MFELRMEITKTRRKLLDKSVSYIIDKINDCGYSIHDISILYNKHYSYPNSYYVCFINIEFENKILTDYDYIQSSSISKLTYFLSHINKFADISEMQIKEINQKG